MLPSFQQPYQPHTVKPGLRISGVHVRGAAVPPWDAPVGGRAPSPHLVYHVPLLPCYLVYLVVCGYVLMPEYVHVLVSEPKNALLGTAIQALKLSVTVQ